MAENSLKFKIEGLNETLSIFNDLAKEIGDKDATSKILVPAVREAMQPVLSKAIGDAPKDTGLLAKSLGIAARRPTNKDRKSMYITATDTVVAIVSSKVIPKRLKDKFSEAHTDLIAKFTNTKKGSKARESAYKDVRRAKRKFYEQHDIAYDARIVAMEFGTAHNAAKPFLRNSLESQSDEVARKLGDILQVRMSRFIAKTRK